jgi:hypothetical protein
MTPEQERAILQAATLGLESKLEDAYEKLTRLIRSGVDPRDAVQQVIEGFSPAYADIMAKAFSAILATKVGSEAALAMEVGTVQLSQKLYAQSSYVSEVVTGLVDKHARGFQDARKLALQLFEGYGFRDPAAEPLQIKASNPTLPKYLREALLADSGIQGDITKAFAKLQVDNLKSQALRAAYADVLRAIDALESGKGAALLDKRLKVAFFERMRYFANRITRTELHKAYAVREARMLMDDPDVEYVQIRRNPTSDSTCICSLIAGRDKYGLGKGVYPKRSAPVPPFHPYCLCVQSPRLDLTGKKERPADENADRYFLSRIGAPMAAQVMGSRERADMVMRSGDALAVVNAKLDPVHQIRVSAQV